MHSKSCPLPLLSLYIYRHSSCPCTGVRKPCKRPRAQSPGACSVLKRLHLSVDVAEWTGKGIHGISLGDVGELSLEHLTKGHGVVEGTVAAGRKIQEGDGVSDGVLAVLNVLILPNPPDAVDLSVVN